ncbi:unnamed protein product [Rhizoctonia solani]|uniref:Ribosome maturation protein SDO1/SBDS N-terminal domain-containing protein n=1 Tax=Rhizoctonia solani TaxID=456999 RepID=A0A8H3BW61_9AGAM|nr:unnamed protein product [Rhizoctonia solani]
MGKEITIAVYKPSSQSTEEYMVVVDPVEHKKYKEGDTSVPLSRIVDSYSVYHSSTGHTGKWGKASKQQLEGTFETSKDDDVVKIIVDKGVSRTSDSFASKLGDTNLARGSGNLNINNGPR